MTLGVSPIQVRNGIREWELMLEVSIPLQQGTRRAQEAEPNALVAAARARAQATENQVLQELAEHLAAFEAARAMERLTASALQPQAEITLRSASASYTLPLAIAGGAIAAFHVLLVAGVIPESIRPCSQGVPCKDQPILWLGFISLPLLSLAAFSSITALLLGARHEVST